MSAIPIAEKNSTVHKQLFLWWIPFMVGAVQMAVFRDITLQRINLFRCFRRTCYLHLKGH